MIDPIAVSVDAVTRPEVHRLPLVFLAGALTSVGPCAAPRYVALAALLGTGRARWMTTAVFVAGILAAYAALGYGLGLLAALSARVGALDAVLAAALAGAGIVTLLREPQARGHACRPVRTSAVFLLGAGSAAVISPCCSPVIAAVAGMAAFDRDPLASAAVLATFALGHCAPLGAIGSGGAFAARAFARPQAAFAVRTVGGALLVGLGAYYGLLA
jgi:cytochrome c-type biogenesis protein